MQKNNGGYDKRHEKEINANDTSFQWEMIQGKSEGPFRLSFLTKNGMMGLKKGKYFVFLFLKGK